LRQAGFDAVHTGEIGLAEAPDEEILRRASLEDRVVVTLDADFHALLALSKLVNGIPIFGSHARFGDCDCTRCGPFPSNGLSNPFLRPIMERTVRVSRVNDDARVEQDHRVSCLICSQLWVNRSGLLLMLCKASSLVHRRRGGGIRRKVIASAPGPRISGS